MSWKTEWKKSAILVVVFTVCFYLPIGIERFDNAVIESLHLIKWYAQEHALLCLAPAFFIAGAIAVFVSQASVMKYLGAKANKVLAYGVASISGTILAVCSCTVLPLFAGIYKMGAGLGPATAFLYSGPAINVLAIILTARVLGLEIGIARAVGAVVFSIVIGFVMHLIYRKEEVEKANGQMAIKGKGLLATLILGLVFGVALGPCTFAYMAPTLAVAFNLAAANPAYAAGLLLSYGVGHCRVIVLAGTSAELVQRYMDWNEKSKATIIIKRICGVVIILCGLYLIYITNLPGGN